MWTQVGCADTLPSCRFGLYLAFFNTPYIAIAIPVFRRVGTKDPTTDTWAVSLNFMQTTDVFFFWGGGGASIFQKKPNMDDIEWRLALVLDMQILYEYPSKLFKFTRQDTCFLICKRKFHFQSLMFAELKTWAMERKPGWNLCFPPLAFHILVLI